MKIKNKIIQERLKQERQAQRLSSLATAVANLKSQGIEDPATLLDYINTYQKLSEAIQLK